MMPSQLQDNEDVQADFIRELLASAGTFRPYAVFDEPLDCIRVVVRDCSVTEIRINDALTVLEANYPEVQDASEIVGFTIKGVAHLCQTHGISATAPWRVADFLDAVLQASAPRERVFVKTVVRPMAAATLDVDKMAA